MIKAGMEKSVLSVLEERGYVKDVAGGRQALDFLMTDKRIGAYVGVDPTAPSLHVGHLLPLMVLYWMYLLGFTTVTLLGGGTVKIGDPSGRSGPRKRQAEEEQRVYVECMRDQLKGLWGNVNALGVKHNFPSNVGWSKALRNNADWLDKLTAVDLMRDLGSGMRLAEMLNRDSVKVRMENGTGMSFAEFSYPLFQGYDWSMLYKTYGVQLQIGGSDQYGNICSGVSATGYMHPETQSQDEPNNWLFGLTTPLLTTASGEKFGKSAGNAVWLDPEMMSSYDLYQYFLRTSDADVERYLKLFTFIPLEHIQLVMCQQERDPSKRTAQHILAKEIVELAHGARAAMLAEKEHKEAFSFGTTSFPLAILKQALVDSSGIHQKVDAKAARWRFKEPFLKTSNPEVKNTTAQTGTLITDDAQRNVVMIPRPMVLSPVANFTALLHAAGLVSSKSEAHRLIKNGGAYIAYQALPENDGSGEAPKESEVLPWVPIRPGMDQPKKFLCQDALVLRAGKTKWKICKILSSDKFEDEMEGGLSVPPGWEQFKTSLEQFNTEQK
ncbi:tyrosyl-tRNA synthetase [Delitschia confertaspora ATCC 74209]|uniref:Tyrosine--tRNA ligase n=1 Tax=Delitschia confertaspora ATCC 74209 TaxID=1513339 RepID=A0A9P4JX44_9PLEO|nr:tyrosyl-tRNA synthetase [Delitschia confertaspora ATCC 74209]